MFMTCHQDFENDTRLNSFSVALHRKGNRIEEDNESIIFYINIHSVLQC